MWATPGMGSMIKSNVTTEKALQHHLRVKKKKNIKYRQWIQHLPVATSTSAFDRLRNDISYIENRGVLSRIGEMSAPANIMQSTFEGVTGDIPSVWTASNSIRGRKTRVAADRA